VNVQTAREKTRETDHSAKSVGDGTPDGASAGSGWQRADDDAAAAPAPPAGRGRGDDTTGDRRMPRVFLAVGIGLLIAIVVADLLRAG
jgi:hypothetical protein